MPHANRAHLNTGAEIDIRLRPFELQGKRLDTAFHELIPVIGITMQEFLPPVSGDGDFPEATVGRQHVYEVFAGHRPLRRKTAQSLVDRLNLFLRCAVDKHKLAGTFREWKHSLRRFSFLRVAAQSIRADSNDLLYFYEGSINPGTSASQPVYLEIKGEKPIGMTKDQENKWAQEMVRQGKFGLGRSEGCTKITLAVTREQADEIISRYVEGEFEDQGVVAVREVAAPRNWLEKKLLIPSDDIEVGCASGPHSFSEGWKFATFMETLVRPWRRLRWIFSPEVRCTPLARVFAASGTRYYAAEMSGQSSALAVDLGVCWIAWPLLTAIGLFVALSFLQLGTSVALGLGLACGMALAFSGAQVCACVVSPLACSAGGVVMALGFGVAHAIIFGKYGSIGPLSGDAIRRDPFSSVAGGVLGLAAPDWRGHFTPIQALLLLFFVASAIGVAGWLMAQPRKAGQPSLSMPGHQDILTGILSALAGGLIGLVYGSTILLARLGLPKPLAFGTAFTIIGGAAFGATVWLRLRRAQSLEGLQSRTTSSLVKAFGFAGLHVLVSSFLVYATFTRAGSTLGFVALAVATAWFHSTWFTAAHIIADRYGSPRSAVIATTLEGAVGFTVFILSRAL